MAARILPDSVHMTNPFAYYRAWWNHLDMRSSLKMSMNWACPHHWKIDTSRCGPSPWGQNPTFPADEKSDTRGKTRCGSRRFLGGENPQCQFVIIHVETTYSYTVFFKRRISLQFSSISDWPCRPKRLQSLAAKTNANKKRYCHVRWNKTQTQMHAHHIRRPDKVSGKWAINHHKAVNSYKWVVTSN